MTALFRMRFSALSVKAIAGPEARRMLIEVHRAHGHAAQLQH